MTSPHSSSLVQSVNEANLRRFIGEWGKSFEAAVASFREHLAAEAVWEQVGSATTHSADAEKLHSRISIHLPFIES